MKKALYAPVFVLVFWDGAAVSKDGSKGEVFPGYNVVRVNSAIQAFVQVEG